MKIFFITMFGIAFLGILIVPWNTVHGATNINSGQYDHWSWNDVVGWFNWYSSLDVNVESQQLTGHVNFNSSVGDISLNCSYTSSCGTGDYKVLNDGAGYLSGWAWNDTFGWFSFCGGGSRSDCPGTVYYQVHIDAAKEFRGYAWNDILGWVSFNCLDLPGSSPCTNAYRVKTDWGPAVIPGWLESATIDTGDVGGAQFNSIVWRGSQPAGTAVKFKFATSDCSNGKTNFPLCNDAGVWTFYGQDCTGNPGDYYYGTGPDKSIPLSYKNSCNQNNKRYFRYRVYLDSDITQRISPRIDDVIVNWSP